MAWMVRACFGVAAALCALALAACEAGAIRQPDGRIMSNEKAYGPAATRAEIIARFSNTSFSTEQSPVNNFKGLNDEVLETYFASDGRVRAHLWYSSNRVSVFVGKWRVERAFGEDFLVQEGTLYNALHQSVKSGKLRMTQRVFIRPTGGVAVDYFDDGRFMRAGSYKAARKGFPQKTKFTHALKVILDGGFKEPPPSTNSETAIPIAAEGAAMVALIALCVGTAGVLC